jgi:hypothetical protein
MMRDFMKLFSRTKKHDLLPFKPLASINIASERRKLPASPRKDPDRHDHPASVGAKCPNPTAD